ncbi:protein-disulfide reductase DsbD domain-containing protein [Rhodobacter viridis]|nr:protein-disulfide reductase DsbD domain-containing protein [Rhodobacter viridis]
MLARFLAFSLCLALAAPLAAEEVQPMSPGLLSAELLPGWQEKDGSRVAAIRIALAPGWKTYWRVPGDVGVPPQFDFNASTNVAALQVIWPAPEVFEAGETETVGYHDTLVLPLRITPKAPKAPVTLTAELEFGICDEVCVPVSVALTKDLSGPGAENPEIVAAMAAAPRPGPGLARCTVTPIRDGMRVAARIDMPQAAGETALFELRSRPMWVSEPEISRQGDQLLASVDFVPEDARPFDLDPADLRITVVSHGDAVEIDGCPTP